MTGIGGIVASGFMFTIFDAAAKTPALASLDTFKWLFVVTAIVSAIVVVASLLGGD